MNETDKERLKGLFGKAADELSDKALAAAKEQTNRVWKWLLYAVGIMLAGIAALAGFTGCNGVPQVDITSEQIQRAETIYTALGGEVKYRVVPVVEYKK